MVIGMNSMETVKIDNTVKINNVYYVVHDKKSREIIISTLRNSRESCLESFFVKPQNSKYSPAGELYRRTNKAPLGISRYNLEEWFTNHPSLSCDLVDLKLNLKVALESRLW